MKSLREPLGVAADISGLLAFIGLSGSGVLALLRTQISFSWQWVALPFALGILSAVVIYPLVQKAGRRLHAQFAGRAVRDPITLSASQLSDLLPSNDLLAKWYDRLKAAVETWDAKATLTQFELFLSMGEKQGDWVGRVTIEADSDWRKLHGTFSLWVDKNYMSKKPHGEFDELSAGESSVNPTRAPFFKEFSHWRKAVVLAYGPIEHLPRARLQVAISSKARDEDMVLRVQLFDILPKTPHQAASDVKPVAHPAVSYTKQELA